MDDTVGDLDVLLLEVDTVDGRARGTGLEGLATKSGNVTSISEGRGSDLTRANVVLEDLSKVGDVLELKLGDSELLGVSSECIIIRGEDSELGVSIHESLVKASLGDKRAEDHVVGVLGNSTIDRSAMKHNAR